MNISEKTRKAALMGVLLAVAVALSWLEHILPPLPLLPPNYKYGLSNIVVMYCFFQLGARNALALNALKSLFVVLTRGPLAGGMGFCGGVAAVLTLALLTALFSEKLSYVMAGVSAALSHNLGQLAAAAVVVRTNILPAYLPALLVAGVLTGTLTGTLLKICLNSAEKMIDKSFTKK